jgi:hypothetical protein
MQKTG